MKATNTLTPAQLRKWVAEHAAAPKREYVPWQERVRKITDEEFAAVLVEQGQRRGLSKETP